MNNTSNKRIGILTFHKSINYGSVLQTWALQRTLQQFGYDVHIIDYEPTSYNQVYRVFARNSSLKNFLYNAKRIPIAYFIEKQIELFLEFRTKNLSLTDCTYYNVTDLEKDCKKFDILICGSDQVWNVHAHDCDDIFFLPFRFHGKKIAYAVSVNNTNFTEKRCNDQLRKNMQDFFAISCREKSGADRISRFANYKNVFTALDPTLLLEKRQYEDICSKEIIKHRYIFLYNVWAGGDALSIAKKVSDAYKMPVYTMLTKRSMKSIIKMECNGIHVLKLNSAPGDFLSLIKYADFVISDSFHGTAFSLIFEKQFVSVNQRIEDSENGHLKNDERLVNILELLGLGTRLISIEDSDKIFDMDSIDYTVVTPKRMEIAKQSVTWLAENLM